MEESGESDQIYRRRFSCAGHETHLQNCYSYSCYFFTTALVGVVCYNG